MINKKSINVAILGATGIIGQVFVHLLSNHRFFKIKSLFASEKRTGKKYSDTVNWLLPYFPNPDIQNLKLDEFNMEKLRADNIKYIFSALPASAGMGLETELKQEGFFVFSNSSAHRRDPDVPILIPEVNKNSIYSIEKQGFPDTGFIITNPNCSTSGLALALAPLKKFGIEEITVSTYQAISGAGFPGLSALEINNTVIPHIKGEEEKIVFEVKKILDIKPEIYPTCIRIPVTYGHLETLWIKFTQHPSHKEITDSWDKTGIIKGCPTLPDKPVFFQSDPYFPGNNFSFSGKPEGMQIFTGGLKERDGKWGFNLLVNNVIRGGAGGSVANAELFSTVFGDIQ